MFRRIAERAALNPNGRYVLVIDEINHGNIPAIFGELITLMLVFPSPQAGAGSLSAATVAGVMRSAGRTTPASRRNARPGRVRPVARR